MDENRKQLVISNMPFATYMAKKYYGTGADRDDLQGASFLGLCKAAANYNPEKGILFSTYAGRVIENEIFMELRKKKKTTEEVSIFQEIGEGIFLQDTIPDPADPYEEFHRGTVENMQAEEIIENCRYLDGKERTVLKKQYLEQENQTRIAGCIGISQSGVSRISKRAKTKLRRYYAAIYA